MNRRRQRWSAEEGALLKRVVAKAQSDPQPLDWHTVAARIPGRTNEDCRKRWESEVGGGINKGAWSTSEDERLYDAVKEHGTKWALVGPEVRTRNGDQCSKRWNHAIGLALDHCTWTPEEDKLLLQAVAQTGQDWITIVGNYFPHRIALALKDRYMFLCRGSRGDRTTSIPKVTQDTSITSTSTSREGYDPSYSGKSPMADGIDCHKSGKKLVIETSDEEEEISTNSRPRMGTDRQSSDFDLSAAFPAAMPNLQFDLSASGNDIDSMHGSLAHRDTDAFDDTPQPMISSSFSFSDFSAGENCMEAHQRPAPPNTPSSIPPFWVNENVEAGSPLNGGNYSTRRAFGGRPTTPFINNQDMCNQALIQQHDTFGSSNTYIQDRSHHQQSPSHLSSTMTLMDLDQNWEDDDTRRVTIDAVCSANQLGKLVQAVMELATSATVNTGG